MSEWGPFRVDLDSVERRAQLRCLRLAVRLIAGRRGTEASTALLVAEISDGDAAALADAQAAIDKLPGLDRRQILSSFASVLPPTRGPTPFINR